MTLTEVVNHLNNPSLLTDITMPQPREAVRWAAEYVLDLRDLQLAAQLYLERPDELRRRLLSDCLERLEARAAA